MFSCALIRIAPKAKKVIEIIIIYPLYCSMVDSEVLKTRWMCMYAPVI